MPKTSPPGSARGIKMFDATGQRTQGIAMSPGSTRQHQIKDPQGAGSKGYSGPPKRFRQDPRAKAFTVAGVAKDKLGYRDHQDRTGAAIRSVFHSVAAQHVGVVQV